MRGAPGIYVRLDDPFGARRAAAGRGIRRDPFAGLGKIAALGIKVSRHCTYHGVALNVAMDLRPFARIDPCGYAGLRTVDLSTIGVRATWDEAAQVLGDKLGAYLSPDPPSHEHPDVVRDAQSADDYDPSAKQKAEAKTVAHPDQGRAGARC